MRWLVAVLATVLTLAATHPAEAARKALVIGNAAYKARPLANPVNDASDMAARLQALGFAVTVAKDATRRQMAAAILGFQRALVPGDEAVVFYAGHGMQVRGQNWLLPVDADPQAEAEVEYEAIGVDAVLRGIGEAGARTTLVLLDACRDNPFEQRFRGGARGLARVEAAASGTLVSYAAKPGTVAADGRERNSPYTTAWLAALAEPGLTHHQILDRVHISVKRATGDRQETWEEGRLAGTLVLNPATGGTAAAGTQAAAPVPAFDPALVELRFWETVVAGNTAAEYEAYLAQYPAGRFASLAKARLAALKPASAPVAAASATASPPVPARPPGDTAPGTRFRDCPECPEMIWIPPGEFTMGSPANEPGRDEDEGPQHSVRIGVPLAVGVHEVTFAEWDACVAGGGCNGYRPDDQGWGRGNRPVINVSWPDVKAYVAWLSQKTGQRYRLLSESEWEYAARAGTTTRFSCGDSDGCLGSVAWYSGNAGRQTRPVGGKGANAFGLHDMHGNVWERTEDCWNDNYVGAPLDGAAWTAGDCGRRVVRGGSWAYDPQYLRAAIRFRDGTGGRGANLGFRVAR